MLSAGIVVCSACQIFEPRERYVQMPRKMNYSIICWHPIRMPCSTTCLLHNTRYASKQQHGRCYIEIVVSSLPIFTKTGSHRCVLAGELTDVIVSTASEQTSAFCLAPDLINESDPWQFGACQCSRGVCVANTLSCGRSPEQVLLFALRLSSTISEGDTVNAFPGHLSHMFLC